MSRAAPGRCRRWRCMGAASGRQLGHRRGAVAAATTTAAAGVTRTWRMPCRQTLSVTLQALGLAAPRRCSAAPQRRSCGRRMAAHSLGMTGRKNKMRMAGKPGSTRDARRTGALQTASSGPVMGAWRAIARGYGSKIAVAAAAMMMRRCQALLL